MRLMLITAGSRGDVEPFAALAREAMRRGHQVRLALPDNSGVDVDGLDAHSLGVDFARLVAGQGVSPWAAARALRDTVRPLMRELFVNAVQLCLDFAPDVIVHHPKVLSAGLAAERLGVPRVVAEITPSLTATSAFPAPGVVNLDLGPLNRATYLAAAASARMFAAELAAAAERAGQPPTSSYAPAAATLVPVSRFLLRRPADWPDSVQLTGPWTEPKDEPLDSEVERFLDRGPFLYAGFGSMAAGDPVARAAHIISAARERSLNVVLATGWGGLVVPDTLRGNDVLVARSLPHDQVLPRAVAAVHHGGAGTVHAAARAQTVSLVVPFFADQPFWGRQLHRRGLAPRPVPQRRLSTRRLGRALDSAEEYRGAVREVGEAMRTEDGLGTACQVIETLSGRPARHTPEPMRKDVQL